MQAGALLELDERDVVGHVVEEGGSVVLTTWKVANAACTVKEGMFLDSVLPGRHIGSSLGRMTRNALWDDE